MIAALLLAGGASWAADVMPSPEKKGETPSDILMPDGRPLGSATRDPLVRTIDLGEHAVSRLWERLTVGSELIKREVMSKGAAKYRFATVRRLNDGTIVRGQVQQGPRSPARIQFVIDGVPYSELLFIGHDKPQATPLGSSGEGGGGEM